MAKVARRLRPGGMRHDHGAVAVEFALVTLPLLLILFGIIDYGIWFSDSISARQAVRDGARNGAVETFGSCNPPPPPTAPDADLHNLYCTIAGRMDQISGKTYLRVMIAQDPITASFPLTPPSGSPYWQSGRTLRVCAITQHTSLLPLVPFPAGGIARTRVDIPIEQAAGANVATRIGYTDNTLPPGTDWNSWCP